MSELSFEDRLEIGHEAGIAVKKWRNLGNAQIKCGECEDITEHLRCIHYKVNPKSITILFYFHCLKCGTRSGSIVKKNISIRKGKTNKNTDVYV